MPFLVRYRFLSLCVQNPDQAVQLPVQLLVTDAQAVHVAVYRPLPFLLRGEEPLVHGVQRFCGIRDLHGLLAAEKSGKASLFPGYGTETCRLPDDGGQAFQQQAVMPLEYPHRLI